MAFFKEVWQYTQGDRGFSEVYYSFASSLTNAATFPAGLLTSAVRIRNGLTVLRKIRISDVTNNRNSVVININRPAPSLGTSPDLVSSAAVCTLNAPDTGGKRQIWLRGLDDDDVLRSATTGLDTPSAALRNGMNSFIRALANAGYYVRSLKKLGVAPLVYTTINSVTVVNPGQVTIGVPATFALTASGRVILSQLDQKLFPGLNGHWKATSLGSTAFSVAYNSHLANGTYTVTKGRTRPEEYDYGAISADVSGFSKFNSRDTGRSPLGGRGRRSTRLLRSA